MSSPTDRMMEFNAAMELVVDFSPWKPFPPEMYSSTCEWCPKPGWENLSQRAFIRAIALLEGRHDRHGCLLLQRTAWCSAAYYLAAAMEAGFSVFDSWMEVAMQFLTWMAAVASFLLPAWYLFSSPDAQLPPIAQLLQSALLVVLTIAATRMGVRKAADARAKEAEQRANNRWLPQARQACLTLQTLQADVRALRQELAASCGILTRDLPEMQATKLQGARTVLRIQCQNGAQRLDSVANHLDDAVAAWNAFIGENCEGFECDEIAKELGQHRLDLAAQLNGTDWACSGPPADGEEAGVDDFGRRQPPDEF